MTPAEKESGPKFGSEDECRGQNIAAPQYQELPILRGYYPVTLVQDQQAYHHNVYNYSAPQATSQQVHDIGQNEIASFTYPDPSSMQLVTPGVTIYSELEKLSQDLVLALTHLRQYGNEVPNTNTSITYTGFTT